jgi:prevent-host-death family protein
MVIDDYLLVMTRKSTTVGVAELKARLSEYLRSVRRGGDVTIRDRSEPIARLVPYTARDERLVVREPQRQYKSLGRIPMPRPMKLRKDPVQLLLEERRSGR